MISELATHEVERGTFARQGYLIEPGLLDILEAEELADELEAWVQARYGANGAGLEWHPAAGPPADLSGRLAALPGDPRLTEPAAGLLGGPVRAVACRALVRPPRVAARWRQECALYRPTPRHLLCVALALEDAIEETGCMLVLPRSHLDGLFFHAQVEGEWCADASRPSLTPGHIGHAIALPAGGAAFFDGLLLHATTINRTAQRFCQLQIDFMLDGVTDLR